MKLATFFFLAFSAVLAAPNEPDNRIIDGRPAPVGAFPYHASIKKYGKLICNGAIIDETTILTTARCLHDYNIEGMQVFVGSNHLNSGGQTYNASAMNIHEYYLADYYGFNIGYIKVFPGIEFNELVKPVSLASKNPEEGSMVTFSGWGITTNKGKNSEELMMIDFKSLTGSTCANMNMPLPIDIQAICTKHLQPRQCLSEKDFGGPLVDQNGDLVGLLSWNVECSQEKPDVFENTPFFIDWIKENVHDYTSNYV